jgi:quinol-cytochrome oxidoreductase complex cytochrome b subunit
MFVSLARGLSILLILKQTNKQTKQNKNKKQKNKNQKKQKQTAFGFADFLKLFLYSFLCFYLVDFCPEFDYSLLSTPLW